jgi:hypothetical protein
VTKENWGKPDLGVRELIGVAAFVRADGTVVLHQPPGSQSYRVSLFDLHTPPRVCILISKVPSDLKDAGKEHKSRWLLRAVEGR